MSDTATFSERLVNRIARIGGGGSSRRGFLGGAALVGAALAVDPWGYLTRPTTAYAATCGTDASCGAGYSVFCCTINGGRNTCPSGTFAGGWWKADRSSYCGGAARYYIDCNVLPGHHFRCRCNTTSCDHRLVACNWFRYGQCSTHIDGVTPVVCRQISCTPPWQIYKSCGRSSATDNNTARHTAPCLTERNTFPRERRFPAAPAELYPRHSLRPGQRLTSHDRRTTCVMLANGNLAIYNVHGLQWTSHTNHVAAGGHVYLRPSGNLVMYSRHGKRVWSTHTAGATGRVRLQMRNSGRLVIYNGREVLWSSHTQTD